MKLQYNDVYDLDPDQLKQWLSEDNHADSELAEEIFREACYHLRLVLVRILIEAGCKFNQLHSGSTVLLWVCRTDNHLELVKLLVEAGADINFIHSGGETALTEAVLIGENGRETNCSDFPIASYLLSMGANPNELFIPEINTTLLMAAATWGKTDLVSTLLKYGANAAVTDKLDLTAWMYAYVNEKHETAALLPGAPGDWERWLTEHHSTPEHCALCSGLKNKDYCYYNSYVFIDPISYNKSMWRYHLMERISEGERVQRGHNTITQEDICRCRCCGSLFKRYDICDDEYKIFPSRVDYTRMKPFE